MKYCPNKSHPTYVEIVTALGEEKASHVYILNRFEIPSSLDEAKRILSKEEKGMPIIPEALVPKIKATLNKQKAIYKREQHSTKLISQIDNILNSLEQGDKYEGILYLIRSANSLVTSAEQRIIKIKNLLINASYDALSDVEKQDIADQINQLKEFVSTYTILDDIKKNIFKKDGSSIIGPHAAWLTDAIERRELIIDEYQDLSYALTVKWLKPQVDRVNANLEKAGKSNYILTEERLIELLKHSDTEAKTITALLGTTANSKDPILGLVASTIKRELETQRLSQIERQERLYSFYENKPGSKGSQDDFNKPYYHYIENKEYIPEFDVDGKPIMVGNKQKTTIKFVKRAAFHTEIRTDLFEKAKYKFFDALKERFGGNTPIYGSAKHEEWLKSVSEWFRENTELVDTKALIAEKRSTLSPQKFQRWLEDNLTEKDNLTYMDGSKASDYYTKSEIYSVNNSTFSIYTGNFKRPAIGKYGNKTFERLMATDSYYNQLYTEYKKANDKIHVTRQLKHGIIPQEFDDRRNAFLKNPLNVITGSIKRDFTFTTYDQEYGVITPSGERKKYIPIHFTSLIEDKDLSKDLLQSVLKFSEVADNYKAMSDILPNVAILTDLIKGNVKLNIEARTSLGIKDVITKLQWTEEDASKINKQLLDFLDKIVYGETEIMEKFNLAGTNISVNKLAKKLGTLTAAMQLMGNITSSINNATIGNFQNILQSVGGRYYTAGDYAKAVATYVKNLPNLVQDVINGIPTSKIGRVAQLYDAIQGEFLDNYGRKISGNAARRLLTTDAGYFMMKGAEQQIQYSGMMALMMGQKVNYNGTTITLWEAYDETGKLKTGVEWSENDRFNFMQKLHKMNKELHGVYNKFDSPSLSRKWYGKLALMFRKYLYSTIRKRFVNEYVDMEAGDVTVGYYNVFYTKLLTSLKNLSIESFTTATEDEKLAIKKSILEIGTFIAVNILIFGLSGLDDDDDDLATKHFELQLRRFSDDIGFYMGDINAGIRILQSPSVTINTVQKLQRAISQTFLAPNEVYEKKPSKYSSYDAGDRKLWKLWNDLLPIKNKIDNFLDPSSTLSFVKQRTLF